LITGGGSGLGAANALYLAGKGANVVITGRREDKLNEVVSKFTSNHEKEKGGSLVGVTADVTKEEDWPRVVSTVVSKFGGLDVAIMNAGWEGPAQQDPVEADMKQIEQLFKINVMAPIIGAKYVLKELEKKKGFFFVVSSAASCLPRAPGTLFPIYSVTKSAADSVVRQLSSLYSLRGIRFFGINPFCYESEMFEKVSKMPAVSAIAATKEEMGGLFNPLGDPGHPLDLDVVYELLITSQTKYVTGDSICVAPGPTPGKPLTVEVGYFYGSSVCSTAPDALFAALLNMPILDASGNPRPPEEADQIRAKIKEHLGKTMARLAALLAPKSS